LVLSEQDHAEVVGSLGVVWLNTQSRSATGDGPVKLAEGAVGFRQVAVVDGGIWTEGNGSTDEVNGPRVVAQLVGDYPQQVEAVHLIRLTDQDVAVQARRLIEGTSLMMLERQIQGLVHAKVLAVGTGW
jgi:hypothetical protein